MTLPYVVPQDLAPSLSLPFNGRDTPLGSTSRPSRLDPLPCHYRLMVVTLPYVQREGIFLQDTWPQGGPHRQDFGTP